MSGVKTSRVWRVGVGVRVRVRVGAVECQLNDRPLTLIVRSVLIITQAKHITRQASMPGGLNKQRNKGGGYNARHSGTKLQTQAADDCGIR